MTALPADVVILIYISLPALLVAGVLLLARKSASTWQGIGLVFSALIVGAAWSVVIAGYLTWIVVRDGWATPAGVVASAVLASALLLGGGAWHFKKKRRELDCGRAYRFYEVLAAAPAGHWPSLIAQGGKWVTSPSACAYEGLRAFLGRDPAPADGNPPLSEEARLDLLAALLAGGLPPSFPMLADFARDGELGSVRLIIARRQALVAQGRASWGMFPAKAANAAMNFINFDADGVAIADDMIDDEERRYRDIIRLIVATVPPKPSALSGRLRRGLEGLGLL